MQKDEEWIMQCYLSATAEKFHTLTTQQKKGGRDGAVAEKRRNSFWLSSPTQHRKVILEN